MRGPAGGTSGLPKFAAEIFRALAKAGGRPQGSRKGGGFAIKILEWSKDLWVNHTSPPLKVYTLGRFAVLWRSIDGRRRLETAQSQEDVQASADGAATSVARRTGDGDFVAGQNSNGRALIAFCLGR